MAADGVVIGLVAEGKHDQMALEAVIGHLRRTECADAAVMPRRLQPAYRDATRSGMSSGGADRVRQWCLVPPGERTRRVFSPPFVDPDAPPCDIVVVLHDADRLDQTATHCPAVPLPEEPHDAAKRARYIESVLDSWLWPSMDDRTPENRHSDYVSLAAVQALETWYVAALDPAIQEPEEVDPVAKMIALDPNMQDHKKPGRLKKRWMDDRYNELNSRLIGSIDRVQAACPQFRRLIAELRGRLPGARP